MQERLRSVLQPQPKLGRIAYVGGEEAFWTAHQPGREKPSVGTRT
jgi:hypothetical protein